MANESSLRVTVLGDELEPDLAYLEAGPATVRRQVREYERGERRAFDLRVSVPDSFRGRVLGAICSILYGETRTYGELAADLDTAPVAVGQACARNPVPLVVPCHRVVASDGSLGGYTAPGGIDHKCRLLTHEREHAAGRGRER